MCDKVCEVATFYPLLFRRAIDINLEKNLLWFKLQLILQAEEYHCRCIIWPNAAEWPTMWWRTTLHYSNFDWGSRRPVSTVAPSIANLTIPFCAFRIRGMERENGKILKLKALYPTNHVGLALEDDHLIPNRARPQTIGRVKSRSTEIRAQRSLPVPHCSCGWTSCFALISMNEIMKCIYHLLSNF